MNRRIFLCLALNLLCISIFISTPLYSSNIVISSSNEGFDSFAHEVTSSDFDENRNNKIEKGREDSTALKLSLEPFGNQEDFWIFDWEKSQYLQVRATLLSIGTYCYIYMQNNSIESTGEEQAIKKCNIIRDEFDSTIYPKNYELIGHPNGTLGDVDNDLHITVFLARDGGAYYSPENEIGDSPYSNHREMIYVYSLAEIYHTIADVCHETNHLFLFNQNQNEPMFFSEGLAEFSKYFAGYLSNSSFLHGDMTVNTTMSTTYYSNTPTVSLLFFDEAFEAYASYGIAYLFFFYLAEKYGIEVIKDLTSDVSLQGPEAIEHSLLNHCYNISFNELFLDVITACSIDELVIYDDLYGFINADFQIFRHKKVYDYPKTFSNIKHLYYGVKLKELNYLPNEFTLVVDTPKLSTQSLGVILIFRDENGWNVEQLMIPGTGSKEYLYFTGENIGEAIIVTSLLKEGITYAPTGFSASPYSLLNLSIVPGHQKPGRTSGYTFLTITSTFLFIYCIIVIAKKKE